MASLQYECNTLTIFFKPKQNHVLDYYVRSEFCFRSAMFVPKVHACNYTTNKNVFMTVRNILCCTAHKALQMALVYQSRYSWQGQQSKTEFLDLPLSALSRRRQGLSKSVLRYNFIMSSITRQVQKNPTLEDCYPCILARVLDFNWLLSINRSSSSALNQSQMTELLTLSMGTQLTL